MSKKTTLSQEEKNYIKLVVQEAMPTAADTAIRRAFVSAVEFRDNDRRKIFRETEDLLRAKPAMEENIQEWEAELKQLELIGVAEKHSSKDIVQMATSRITPEQLYESKILNLKAKIERDKEKLEQLNQALFKIQDDKMFEIIELKYFDEWDDDDIAAELECDVRTVRRHKNRLIWKIAVKLRGGEMV